MPERGDLADLCRLAVAEASGEEAVEAYAEQARRVQVRVRGAEVESLSSAETRGLGVRVIRDGRLGFAHAADPDPDEVRELVRTARESARFAEPDDGNVLPALRPVEPLSGLFDDEQATVATERKVAAALELERLAVSRHPEVRKVESASFGDAVSRVAVASTAGSGVPLEYVRTDCWMSASALAERDGETQSGWGFAVGRGMGGLDAEAVAEEAAARAARLLGGTKPSSERLPVILDPSAATSFLSVLAGALSGDAVLKGRSPLAELVGEPVGTGHVTLVDDGRLGEGPASAPFDDEGMPTGRTAVIEGGVLRGFLHNTYTAIRTGGSSTGNAGRPSYRGAPGVAPTNLFLAAGTLAPDELLARAGRAVYVQDVTGLHSGSSSISGTFSVGAAGLRVEEGTFAGALREMTIASTLLDILKDVQTLGADLRFFPFGGGLGAPTVLVGEMTVGGM
jgi:PmbA protein